MATIDDVIARMQNIDASLPASDGVACFNHVRTGALAVDLLTTALGRTVGMASRCLLVPLRVAP